MSMSRNVVQIFALLIACSGFAEAQVSPGDAKHFNKEGLSFDYPSGWSLVEGSNSDAQQLTLTRADADAQIKVFVHRGRITPEKMGDARIKLIDTYVEGTSKQFEDMGGRPQRAPDSTDIGGLKAEGVRITAALGGVPGAAQIYWALVGQRVVVLTFFGPDKELKKFASAWDLVRNSLKIEEIKATPKPTPAPK
jgi:hypothetical protein